MCFKKLFKKKEKAVLNAPEDEPLPVQTPQPEGKIELEPEKETAE